MTVIWRSGARRVTPGLEGPREIQRNVQVDGGSLRFAGTVVHHQDVVAGLADAEIERAASVPESVTARTSVGLIFAQALEVGARHQREAYLAGAVSTTNAAVTRAGRWRRFTSTYFHSPGGIW